MKLNTRKQWLLALSIVAGIVAFTAGGTVQASENGCTTGWGCFTEGTCAFLSTGGGDYCVCLEGSTVTPTCDCSTGQYPPCGGA